MALPEMWPGWAVVVRLGGAVVARLGATTPAFIAVFVLTAVLGVLGVFLARRLDEISGPRAEGS